MSRKLNLGCGNDYKEGYINIDVSRIVRADEHYDIIEGIRESSNSVDEIQAGCILEQIETNKDFVFVLNECHRVLIEGGGMYGYVPSTDANVFHLDPMDKRFFQKDTFNYFLNKHHLWEKFGKSYGFKGWSTIETDLKDNGIITFIFIK